MIAPPSRKDAAGGSALTFDEALRTILRHAQGAPIGSEVVALAQAVGRALRKSVISPVALPPWDNAAMDGYAVVRSDVHGATLKSPCVLPVIGTSVAGADAAALPPVQPGSAMRIMTGAPMPPGADAVVRIEDSDGGTDRVSIVSDRDVLGRGNVRPRGEDVAAGQELFPAGATLYASHIGVLASVGAAAVTVARRPRVAIVSGGDELVLLDRFAEVEAGRRIVSSSSYALPALLRAAGAEVLLMPLVPDTLADLTAAVRSALDAPCDLLITTGGVSVGAHDYTREALQAVGGEHFFWRARIRPGGPIGTGRVGAVPWLGLPGNPVSTMVTAMLFAWPLVRLLGGHAATSHVRVPVQMMDRAETPAPLTHFLRVAVAVNADGALVARLAGAQGSNLLRTMALANALLVVPEHVTHTEPGSTYQAILYPDAPLMLVSA